MPPINDSWLGRYRHGIDEEDGIYTIQLWRADDQTVRFAYDYKCHTNHGYGIARELGVVITASDTEMTVEIVSGSESSWEDMFKEHQQSQLEAPMRTTIPIVRIEDGRPVFRYSHSLGEKPELAFVSAD